VELLSGNFAPWKEGATLKSRDLIFVESLDKAAKNAFEDGDCKITLEQASWCNEYSIGEDFVEALPEQMAVPVEPREENKQEKKRNESFRFNAYTSVMVREMDHRHEHEHTNKAEKRRASVVTLDAARTRPRDAQVPDGWVTAIIFDVQICRSPEQVLENAIFGVLEEELAKVMGNSGTSIRVSNRVGRHGFCMFCVTHSSPT
jgi:hypothetical protein